MPQGKVAELPDDGLTTRERRERPVLAVHTGDGKGKSTAAFGLALRAWSAGWPIGVFQFTKSPKWRVGEEDALLALGQVHEATGQGAPVTWHRMGAGWSWLRTPAEDHARAAIEGWQQVRRDLAAELVTIPGLAAAAGPAREQASSALASLIRAREAAA